MNLRWLAEALPVGARADAVGRRRSGREVPTCDASTVRYRSAWASTRGAALAAHNAPVSDGSGGCPGRALSVRMPWAAGPDRAKRRLRRRVRSPRQALGGGVSAVPSGTFRAARAARRGREDSDGSASGGQRERVALVSGLQRRYQSRGSPSRAHRRVTVLRRRAVRPPPKRTFASGARPPVSVRFGATNE